MSAQPQLALWQRIQLYGLTIAGLTEDQVGKLGEKRKERLFWDNFGVGSEGVTAAYKALVTPTATAPALVTEPDLYWYRAKNMKTGRSMSSVTTSTKSCEHEKSDRIGSTERSSKTKRSAKRPSEKPKPPAKEQRKKQQRVRNKLQRIPVQRNTSL